MRLPLGLIALAWRLVAGWTAISPWAWLLVVGWTSFSPWALLLLLLLQQMVRRLTPWRAERRCCLPLHGSRLPCWLLGHEGGQGGCTEGLILVSQQGGEEMSHAAIRQHLHGMSRWC